MTEYREGIAECIDYLQQRGYRVARARRPRTSAQLKGKKLLTEHKVHRASGVLAVDVCRLCRFGEAVRGHGSHASDTEGCFLCIDRRTDYLYPSVMRTHTYVIAA